MATYKVIQDIEAEDKLIGPFGIRQFIYLIIVAVSFFIGFRLAIVAWFLVLPLIPHTLFFALLALPFGGEQPTETWLLAKIRFAIKPRVRIWDQSGMKELVTITVPKKIEKPLTKNMSEGEVRSRLEALANTIDSRGWAIKNVNVNVFSQPAFAGIGGGGGSDRLIDVGSVAQQTPTDVNAADDILDEQNNPTAQNLERMISASSKAHRDQIVANMKLPTPAKTPPTTGLAPQATTNMGQTQADVTSAQQTTRPAQPDYWFLNQNAGPTVSLQAQPPMTGMTPQPSNLVVPDPAAAQQQAPGLPLQPVGQPPGPLTEEELLDKIHAEKEKTPKNYGHMRVIKTLEEQQAEAATATKNGAGPAPGQPATDVSSNQPVTPAPDPDIIELARNDDLNVETVARQAKKNKDKSLEDGEVVINLH
jgi:PrgI family protein